ncbi:30S ribosome-binding factor RbfA [Candidatus Protochlamydia amoebophila]|uniref:30S ribosome-binding factor RbfA n=1 Tax=Candidatus Protochlamydia amoebophila TaxID=362787 RepID=UPI00058023E4|nr:30S ribosome-binding factor RbfA [Candidatus Protochlamydia amoebophila]
MAIQRTDRLNSLLKEVISEVIRRDVRNPYVTELVTVTRVQISRDLRHAKVFISIIGSEQAKVETIEALKSAAGFIAVNASQKVVMRYFPELNFKLDDSVDKHMRIEELLGKITKERESRQGDNSDQLEQEP